MKTEVILGCLLVASLAVNAYQYSISKASATDEDPVLCAITEPFHTAIPIDREAARGFYSEFANSLIAPDSTTGGVISRAAFDEMFCTAGCNGLTYSFARDSSGRTGPGGNGVFVIFQGVNIEYDHTGDSIKAVNPIDGAKMYRSGNWCPLNCMAW